MLAALAACAAAAAPPAPTPPPAPAYNISQTFNRAPDLSFPQACDSTFYWDSVDDWYMGKAKLTITLLDFQCMGAGRQFHWHPDADEWGYVARGRFSLVMPAPLQDPWPAAYSKAENGSVWYFPKGWWHAITCETDDCLLVLMFNDIQEYAHPAEIDVLDLVHLMTTAEDDIAAATLDVDLTHYQEKLKPRFFSNGFLNDRFQIMPPVPGACKDHDCPFPDGAVETTYLSPVSSFAKGVRRDLGKGVVLYDVKQEQLPLVGHPGAGLGMSGQLMELAAGAIRPLVWVTNANAIAYCIHGTAKLSVYGGITDETKKSVFTAVLTARDFAYIPHNTAFTFREATGAAPAALTLAFDTPSWRDMEAREQLKMLPPWLVDASLNLTGHERP